MDSTPRINARLLEAYVGRNVMIWGRVEQLLGEEATIDADGHVKARLNHDAHLHQGHAVQIIGKVQSDLSVRVLSSTDLGTKIDWDLANQVVVMGQRFKNLFDAQQ